MEDCSQCRNLTGPKNHFPTPKNTEKLKLNQKLEKRITEPKIYIYMKLAPSANLWRWRFFVKRSDSIRRAAREAWAHENGSH